MSGSPRQNKRYPASQALMVRCDDWREFTQFYATDISQGGMFIATTEPPPVLSYIDLRLTLPEGHEISLKARVVHVIPPERATDPSRAGVGIEFLELDAERKMQIHHLIDFARWQGSVDPNASFSRHMETVASASPPAGLVESFGGDAPATPARSAFAEPGETGKAIPRGTGSTARRRKLGDTSYRSTAAVLIDDEVSTAGTLPGASRAPAHKSKASSSRSAEPPEPRVSRAPAGAQPKDASEGPPARGDDSSPPSDSEQYTASSLDPETMRLGMTHLSYKRFAQAMKVFEEALRDSPNDSEARKWLSLSRARECLSRKDDEGAAKHYKAVLQIDEAFHEARKFVRKYDTDKALQGLPFARYFRKK